MKDNIITATVLAEKIYTLAKQKDKPELMKLADDLGAVGLFENSFITLQTFYQKKDPETFNFFINAFFDDVSQRHIFLKNKFQNAFKGIKNSDTILVVGRTMEEAIPLMPEIYDPVVLLAIISNENIETFEQELSIILENSNEHDLYIADSFTRALEDCVLLKGNKTVADNLIKRGAYLPAAIKSAARRGDTTWVNELFRQCSLEEKQAALQCAISGYALAGFVKDVNSLLINNSNVNLINQVIKKGYFNFLKDYCPREKRKEWFLEIVVRTTPCYRQNLIDAIDDNIFKLFFVQGLFSTKEQLKTDLLKECAKLSIMMEASSLNYKQAKALCEKGMFRWLLESINMLFFPSEIICHIASFVGECPNQDAIKIFEPIQEWKKKLKESTLQKTPLPSFFGLPNEKPVNQSVGLNLFEQNFKY